MAFGDLKVAGGDLLDGAMLNIIHEYPSSASSKPASDFSASVPARTLHLRQPEELHLLRRQLHLGVRRIHALNH